MEVAESHSGRVKVWARSAALAPRMCDAVSRSCAHGVCRFLERRPNMDPNQPNQPTGPQYPPNQTPGYQQPGYPPPGSQQPGYVPPPPPGPYSQPMGQQGYNQYGAPPPPQQSAANRWGPSSLGMDANLAAGLGYLFPIIGVIFFFVEKTNRYVKFNAAQATLLAIGGFILGILYVFGSIFLALAAVTTQDSDFSGCSSRSADSSARSGPVCARRSGASSSASPASM